MLAAQPAPPLKNRRCLFSVQTGSVFWQGSRKMMGGKGRKTEKKRQKPCFRRVFAVFLVEKGERKSNFCDSNS